jgi:putative transposase
VRIPGIGTRKLYHILQESSPNLYVGIDKLFTILKANHLLINRLEQVWIFADITNPENRNNNSYLALITEMLILKKLLVIILSDTLNANSILRALQMAVIQNLS